MKYGRVVIVGRPNTGKSTLINAMMQQKVAITSPLPQTTRKTHRVIYTNEKGKFILSDTPGVIHKIEGLVSKRINQEAPRELTGTDVIICLVDISRPKNEEENKVIGLIRKSGAKKILVYNKIDRAVGVRDHLPEYNYLEEEFDRTIYISAVKEKNVKGLINLIFELLPDGEDAEMKGEIEKLQDTARPPLGMTSKEYIAEIIREKAYLFLREEVPYSIRVGVDRVVDKIKIIVVWATIFTNNSRYKKMIIGERGRKIKQIGFNARKELELMSGRKVYLELRVEVDKHWQELC